MIRRDRIANGIARRIDSDLHEGIDRQPALPRNKIPDIPLRKVHYVDGLADVLPPPDIPDMPYIDGLPDVLPPPDIPDMPFLPDVKIGGEGFQKVIDTIKGGESVTPIGKTNRMTMYILIGAVCLVGFIVLRR